MSKMSYLLVLLSLVTSNIYMADSYTLTASYLTQFGYNTQSTSIGINDNKIENIDPNAFIGYERLEYLTITSTNLLTIDLEVFKYIATSIKQLSLEVRSLNKFTNSKNVKLPYLTSFSLYSNLTSLNKAMFNAFPALYWFEVADYANFNFTGSIKTVDVHTFESLSNLSMLSLRSNSITSFEYLQIPRNLKQLFLAYNSMNYFALSRTMGVLDLLDISYNRFRSFKSMDFTFLANLTFLDLSNNPHAYPNEISGHMKPLVNVIHLYLENLSINTIDSNFFKTNTKLQHVYLSYNKISSLDYRAFKGLNDLFTILLYYNNLTKISSGTFSNPYLYEIDLSYNQISQMENSSFYGYSSSFTRIILDNNKLTKILPRTFLNGFNLINLSNNQISEIDSLTFDGCSQIGYLDLSYNKIEKIASGSFNNLDLRDLILSNNILVKLRNSSFVGQIVNLDLSNNRIEAIGEGAFNYANITNTISLNNNSLTKISSTTFAGQNYLWIIKLNDNMLSTIEPGAFANLPYLREVHLENNQLTQLDSSMFAGSNNLQYIHVDGNPILSTANIKSLCPQAAKNCHVYY